MSITSWLRNLRSALVPSRMARKHRRQSAFGVLRAPTRRPCFELLEDRIVPAFLAPVDYGVGSYPSGVTAADLNNDTVLDLAVINYGIDEYDVSVLLGNADGTFQPVQTFPTGANPQSLAVGDFNADGNLDLATANQGDVSMLLGNGDGSFSAPATIETGSGPAAMAVGDFNGDGKLDLGVMSNVYVIDGYYDYGDYHNIPYGHFEGFANVLLGHGDGSFSAPIINSLGLAYYTSAAVADVNIDGNLDFLSVNWGFGTVIVVLGDGTGSLQGLTDFNAGAGSVIVGDVNDDTKIDLIATTDGGVNVLLGDGLGAFGAAQSFAAGGNPVLGDFNGDGKRDIVTSNYNDGTVSVLLGTGAGSFHLPVIATTGYLPGSLATGDFNGDGWLDAATANSSGTLSVLINDHSWPSLFAPYVTVNDVTVTEGNTGTVNATFTLTLSAASDEAITVHYQTADESATAGSDYAGSSRDVTFAAGETSQTISIVVFGDPRAESTESFAVNLTSTDAFIGDGRGVCTILDDEPSVDINDVTVTEGNTGTVNATFTLTLSRAADQAITVRYETAETTDETAYDETADGSATAGSDYTAASGDVTFAAGQTSQTISIPVLGDRLAEPTESFAVNISATDAFVGYGLGICEILDDEPSVSINDVTVTEGNTGTVTAIFTVSLSAASDGAVTVQYASADQTALADSDYQAAGGTVTFAAGETTRTIAVLVNGDTLGELDETFVVNLSSLNAHVADGQGTGIIVGDEPAFVWLNPWAVDGSYDNFGATGAAGDLGQASAAAFAYAQSWGSTDPWVGPATYDWAYVPFQRTFQLVGSPTGWNVTIDGLLSGTLYARSEYAPRIYSSMSAQVVIIQDTTGAVTHELDFGAYWCSADGGSQTLNVSAPGSREGLVADGTYTVIGWLEATATGYAEDLSSTVGQSYSRSGLAATIDAVPWDNRPDISISDATFVEGNNGAVTGYFTVALSNPWNQTVTVDFALADGSATLADNDFGYLDANRTVTFVPGVMQQTIAVQIYGDRKFEPNETFSVILNSPTNATIADGQGQGLILDEEPSISIKDVTVTEGNTGTRPAAFTVTLSVAYDVPVTVGYATANGTATDGSDFQAASGMLTIPAGQTSGTITVPVNGDRLGEPNESFFVNLSNLNYGVITDGQGLGTILDDEPRISISDVTKLEGNTGQTTLFTFTVTLSAAYDEAVTMSFKTTDGKARTSDGDYTAKTGTLTFAPGETTKTITIEVKGDSKKEAKETFYLDLFYSSINSLFTKNRGLGTILNDE